MIALYSQISFESSLLSCSLVKLDQGLTTIMDSTPGFQVRNPGWSPTFSNPTGFETANISANDVAEG